ncbi:MAG: putative glycosyltransferase, partial [Humibacillus sp.]|nr:putative glycosyltransferase [Humibacillus sp.]
MTARVLAVTVLYNSEQALTSWYQLEQTADVRVVVVDNASSDGGAALARQRGLEVVTSPDNVGFGRGCNLGASLADGEEWIAFVNPDVAITAERLLEVADRAPDGVVATSPLLVDVDDEVLGDVERSRPTTWFVIAVWLAGKRGIRSRTPAPSTTSGARLTTEVTSGACLLVRRAAFESAGRFPAWLFFNLEDIVLCEELAALGSIDVDLGARVRHQKLSSADATPL